MNIKYRIISVDSKEHSFVVRYYTELLSEEMLAAQFDDDGSPLLNEFGKPVRCRTDFNISLYKLDASQEEIEKQIKLVAPADWLKLLEDNLNRTDHSPAISKVFENLHVDNEFEHKPPPVFVPAAKPEEDIEALVSKLLSNDK